jgi:hypothetical protein
MRTDQEFCFYITYSLVVESMEKEASASFLVSHEQGYLTGNFISGIPHKSRFNALLPCQMRTKKAHTMPDN